MLESKFSRNLSFNQNLDKNWQTYFKSKFYPFASLPSAPKFTQLFKTLHLMTFFSFHCLVAFCLSTSANCSHSNDVYHREERYSLCVYERRNRKKSAAWGRAGRMDVLAWSHRSWIDNHVLTETEVQENCRGGEIPFFRPHYFLKQLSSWAFL